MKTVYSSAHGMTKTFLGKVGVADAVEIKDGKEKVEEPYILFTNTTGNGEVPENVRAFMKNNWKGIKAVIGNASSERHASTFGFAADKISKEYSIPLLYKYEGEGNEADVIIVKRLLEAWK